MLRYLFRRPRTIRVPVQNGQFDIQKVSVTKNSSVRISRFLTTFIISLCVVRTAGHLFSDRDLNREWERLKKGRQEGEHWKKAHSDISQNGVSPKAPQAVGTQQTDTIHLMLPIWLRRRQQGWYKEDDPQWKSFQRFAQDKKLVHEVKLKIGLLVKEQLRTDRYGPWVRHLNTSRLNINLDVIIPIAPPPFYEIPGIFISPSGEVTYGWRRLPDSVGSKVDRIFHPIMLTKAFYAGCKEFAHLTYVISKARITDRIDSYKEKHSKSEGDRTSSSFSQPTKVLTEEEKVVQRLPVMKSSEQDMKRVLPFLRGEYGEHESRQAYRDVVRFMTYKGAIEMGCAVFRHHWISGQSQELQRKAANVLMFKGVIDCIGERGKLYLEVSASYDVGTNTIVGKPLITGAYVVPHAENWHGNKSRSTFAAPAKASQSTKASQSSVQPPVKRAEPPPETAAAKASSEKEEEK